MQTPGRPEAIGGAGDARRRVGAWLAVALAVGGCSAPGGKAETELVGDGARLRTKFVAAAYVVGPAATSVYVSDVPLETLLSDSTPVQVAHFELLWRPIAGMTPMDSDATNVSIRHVVLVDGQVGIYGGAGFVRIRGQPGEGRLRLSITDATIGLLDSSAGFEDLLSPAQLEGDIVAVDDPTMAMRLRQAISQRVTDAFGVPRFVRADDAEAAPPLLLAWAEGVDPRDPPSDAAGLWPVAAPPAARMAAER